MKLTGKNYTVYNGIAYELLPQLEANSVDLCFTSPEIETYMDLKIVVEILCKVKRLLTINGTMWVHTYDTHDERTGSLKLIPDSFAIEMKKRGWIVRNRHIWHRTEKDESENPHRFKRDCEYVFWLTQDDVNYYFKYENSNECPGSLIEAPCLESDGFSSGFPEELVELAIESTIPPFRKRTNTSSHLLLNTRYKHHNCLCCRFKPYRVLPLVYDSYLAQSIHCHL
jgi:DNA modification methylase